MCHHYQLDTTVEDLRIAFPALLSTDPQPILAGSYYPLRQVPVVRRNDDGRSELLLMEWGLLPSWWKRSPQSKLRTSFQRHRFIARYETVDEKRSTREAFRHRRCLVPVTQFEAEGHYFALPDNRPFAFAGLWECWQSAEESILSCTFLTTESNAEIRAVGQPRMPILLRDASAYSRWLNPDINSCASLTELLTPAEDGVLLSSPAAKGSALPP